MKHFAHPADAMMRAVNHGAPPSARTFGGASLSEQRQNVLIMDDNRSVLKVLTNLLRAEDVQLWTCQEVEAAECLLSFHSFDVLVADLEVSTLGGLDGLRLIRHSLANFPDTRVIVFSGRVDSRIRKLGEELGVTAVLSKPQDLGELRRIVIGDTAPPGADSDTDGSEVYSIDPLAEILSSNRMSAVFQPIVALGPEPSLEATYGVESLVRDTQGSRGMNPEILFGYASRKEQLFETDLVCIRAALREGRNLPAGGNLFINVQPRSLSNPAFVDSVVEMAGEHAFDPGQIVFELTEQRSIVNAEAFSQTIASLRQNGLRVALDDYGEGFANLHLVLELQPDFLKISGLFCQGIENDKGRQTVVRSTVEMAAKLGSRTIMERIETREEFDTLRELGVEFGQGYFLARPTPAPELAERLRFSGTAA